jgi:hypothetical protein
MKETMPTWLRRSDETSKAFEAFETYRDMGYERTVTAAAAKRGKPPEQLFRWKKLYDWEERVTDYDNEISRAEAKKAAAENRRRRQRFGRMSDQLMAFANQALKSQDPTEQTSREIMDLYRLVITFADACEAIGKSTRETDEANLNGGDDYENDIVVLPNGADAMADKEVE